MNTKSTFKSCSTPVQIAIICFGIAGLIMTSAAIWNSGQLPAAQTLTLAALSIATARAKVKLTGTTSLSLLTAAVLLSLMMAGPAAAVIVAVCGVITQSVLPMKKLVLHRVVFNVGMIAVTATVAAYTYQAFSTRFIGIVLAAFVYFLGNSVLMAMIVSATKGGSMIGIWYEHFAPTAPSFLIAAMVSLVSLELLSNYTMMAVALATIAPVYYSSIRLASNRSVPVKA